MMSFFLTFYELINSIRPILRNLSISSKFYQLVWTSSNLALDHFFWEKLFVRCIWFSKWKEAILNEEMNSAPMKNNNFRLWEKSFVKWSQSLVVFLKGLFLARMNCWGGRVVSRVHSCNLATFSVFWEPRVLRFVRCQRTQIRNRGQRLTFALLLY